MNILIFNWRDIKHPNAGGSEKYFHELARRWVKKGNKVAWIAGGWKNCLKNENIDGILVKRVGGELSLYFLAPFEYLKLKEKPDIIIDVDNGLPFFTPLFSNVKKVFHIHHVHKDVWFKEAEGSTLKNKSIAVIAYIIESLCLPFIYKNQNIITISKSSAEEIKKEKIGRVLGVVNPGYDIKNRRGYEKFSAPSLLFMNRIKKYKGAETLIKAFKQIKEKITIAELFIAGKGDYSNKLKEIIRKEGIKGVNFLGFVNDDKKQELFEKSWSFVNPSFKEGWGIVNIEASSFGLPVIGSNVSGIKDSIKDKETGLLFEYDNAEDLERKILVLLKDRKLRERLGKNGEKFAKSFSWDKSAEEYLKMMRMIIGT